MRPRSQPPAGLCVAALVALTVCPAASAGTAGGDPVALARAALLASRHAYQSVPALEDTLTYLVRGPHTDRQPKTIEIRLGRDGDASAADGLLRAVAIGHTFYLTKSDDPSEYVSRPYNGDFGQALAAVAGAESSLFEPPQIAMRSGKSVEACIATLGFNLLGPLRITGFQSVRDARGRRLEQIDLASLNGNERVRLDAATHFLSSIRLHIQPPGAPAGFAVDIQGRFSPRVPAVAESVVVFDPGNRRAVAALADLASRHLSAGKPAPAFSLETPSGKHVALADLKGRVVVLDFWATWCVPCWKGLHDTQQFSDWARRSGLPISVFAIDTMERFPNESERKAHLAAFFKAQGLTLPLMLDRGSEVFQSFGTPGLPSMVVVSPAGTIFRYHQGLVPDVVEVLKSDAKKALAAATEPGPPPPGRSRSRPGPQ